MHYIIAFLFSILIIIKPLECTITIEFCDSMVFCSSAFGKNLKLCGDSDSSTITLTNYSIIDIENQNHPLDGISRIELTQGIAKVGNTVKTAPAIFNAIYVDSNSNVPEADFTQAETAPAIFNVIYVDSNSNVPEADFTQAEFEKALRIMSAAEIKTQHGYLCALRRSFSREQALAIYQKSPYRPGADFTEAEANKATWLMQKSKAKSERGYLKVLQEVFSAERASALLGAFIRGDLIEGVELENEAKGA